MSTLTDSDDVADTDDIHCDTDSDKSLADKNNKTDIILTTTHFLLSKAHLGGLAAGFCAWGLAATEGFGDGVGLAGCTSRSAGFLCVFMSSVTLRKPATFHVKLRLGELTPSHTWWTWECFTSTHTWTGEYFVSWPGTLVNISWEVTPGELLNILSSHTC